MNELKIFENPAFGQVRIVEREGEPWFVGKDVAEALGYSDAFGALKKHVDEEDKQNCQNDSFETPRGMTIINESGLYSVAVHKINAERSPARSCANRSGRFFYFKLLLPCRFSNFFRNIVAAFYHFLNISGMIIFLLQYIAINIQLSVRFIRCNISV